VLRPSERMEVSQCGPRGRWSARLVGIRRARPRLRPEKGGESVPTPQGFDFGGRSGLGGGRRGGASAAGGDDRREPCYGAAEVRLGPAKHE
jgi:hypothetical protein